MLLSLLLSLTLSAGAPADSITNGAEVIRAMHAKYEGKWYRTMTFVQENTETRPDGSVQHSTWLEAMEAPGRLRIDFAPRGEGNGMLFVRDSQFLVQAGAVARARPLIHPLMVLGFDVYTQPPEKTIAALETLGVDLSVVREDVWQGRPVYVVGAAAGDTTRLQFWVDQERLVFVRMLQPTPRGLAETRFNKYYRAGGGWVAPEVEFLLNGERNFLEEYRDVKVDVPVDASLFDPSRWSTAKHWHTGG